MKRALYPGSFDPVHLGHIDVIDRLIDQGLFDELIIGVAHNITKTYFFEPKERVYLIKESLKELKKPYIDKIDVEYYTDLTIDFARNKGVKTIIRSVRSFSDFEKEFETALLNEAMNPNIDTFILPPKKDYQVFRSETIKDMILRDVDASKFVTNVVENALKKKTKKLYKTIQKHRSYS